MRNTVLGLQAIWESVILLLGQVTKYQVLWGFLIGFFVSTIVYGFLITDHPKQVPSVLFEDKAKSFLRLSDRKENGTFNQSFYDFSKKAEKVKAAFLLTVLTLILLILITIATF